MILQAKAAENRLFNSVAFHFNLNCPFSWDIAASIVYMYIHVYYGFCSCAIAMVHLLGPWYMCTEDVLRVYYVYSGNCAMETCAIGGFAQ